MVRSGRSNEHASLLPVADVVVRAEVGSGPKCRAGPSPCLRTVRQRPIAGRARVRVVLDTRLPYAVSKQGPLHKVGWGADVMALLLSTSQDTKSSFDVITVVVAIYGAVLSTALGWNAVQRDRRRLRIRLQWITRQEPGITVKCVNTGHRPIGVEDVRFATRDAWARTPVPMFAARMVGWRAKDHPSPPTGNSTLPILLDESDSAEFHFALDERFDPAGGLIVVDGFGRFHRYRFKDTDRMGLGLALAAHGRRSVMTGDEIRGLAEGMSDPPSREAIERLAQHADRVGPLEVHLIPTTRPGEMQLAARPAGGRSTPARPAITEDDVYIRVQRPPFPVFTIGGLLIVAAAGFAMTLRSQAEQGGITLWFIVTLLALIAVTVTAAVLMFSFRVRRAYRRQQDSVDKDPSE